jgi:hypothetical protein
VQQGHPTRRRGTTRQKQASDDTAPHQRRGSQYREAGYRERTAGVLSVRSGSRMRLGRPRSAHVRFQLLRKPN